MQLKAIIVEDEEQSRQLLQQRIKQWQPNVEVAEACADAKEAVVSFARHKPQIIFLDIFLPGMNGFEFFSIINNLNTPVQCIITTGHSEPEYFQEAIRLGLTDYLLKPIKKEELNNAISNVIYRIESGRHLTTMRDLSTLLANPKINLPIFNGALSINADQVLYALSNGKYSDLYLSGHTKEVINLNITELEQKLQPAGMHRIDRFTIINPKYLHKVSLKNNKVYLQSPTKTIELPVTKPGAEKVFEMLKS